MPKVLEYYCNKSFVVQLKLIGEKELVQFALIFHLFIHGPPLIEYTIMQKLFMQLSVFNNPIQNIGIMGASWETKDCICKQVLKGT